MSISYRKFVWWVDIVKLVGSAAFVVIVLDMSDLIAPPVGTVAMALAVAIGLSGAAVAALEGLRLITVTCPTCGGRTHPVASTMDKRFPQAVEALLARRADIIGNQCDKCGSVCRPKIFGFGMVCSKPARPADPQTQV